MMEYYEHKLDPVGVRPDWLDKTDLIDFNDTMLGWDNSGTFRWCGADIELGVDAIRIPSDHWAFPALKAGKVPVRGGESAPSPEFMQSVKALAKGAMMQWSSGIYHDHAKAILAEIEPDPIKSALQDKWPAIDADALRETLAKHNLKIVEVK